MWHEARTQASASLRCNVCRSACASSGAAVRQHAGMRLARNGAAGLLLTAGCIAGRCAGMRMGQMCQEACLNMSEDLPLLLLDRCTQ